jgi:transposase
MERVLHDIGYAKNFLSIKGIGVVTAASFLGETGGFLPSRNAFGLRSLYSSKSFI